MNKRPKRVALFIAKCREKGAYGGRSHVNKTPILTRTKSICAIRSIYDIHDTTHDGRRMLLVVTSKIHF